MWWRFQGFVTEPAMGGRGRASGPRSSFPREVCGGRVRKTRPRLWEGAGGGRVSVAVGSVPLERVRVCGRVAPSGVAAWFDPVAVRRQRLWVAGWRCPGAVVLSLFPAAAGGGPGGRTLRPLHGRRLLGKSGDDSARVSAETVTWVTS